MSNSTGLKLAFFSFIFAGLSSAAEPLPLSTSYWNDTTFLRSFNGTYRIEARIEPNLTTEERGLLVEIQEMMGDEKRTLSLEKLKSSSLTAKSAALTFNLGNLYFETGDTANAIEAYESALKAYPSFRRAHHNLALALVRENKLDDALMHLTEAIRLGDSEGNTYGLLGYCRIAREEWASALQAYRLAQITEPEVAEWKAGIAQCLQNLDKKTEAVALLEEVIRQRPTEASYAVLQANILMELDQPEAAAKALELPYRLKILDPNATLLLAELHLRGERIEAAERAITTAFSKKEKQPAMSSILRLITAASTRSEWNIVKELLEKAKTDTPARPLRLAEANYLIASEENPASGADLLKKLTQEEPTDGEALIALARYQSTNGQPEFAELLYERATADSSHAYEAHVELVRLHVAQSRYADALKSIDRALEINPTESLSNYRQALLKTIAAAE